MIPVLFALVLAAILFAVGTWGRRNADSLVPQAFSTYGKAKKARQMRLGGRMVQLCAGFLVLLAAVHVVLSAFR